jgi:hypothetical protein
MFNPKMAAEQKQATPDTQNDRQDDLDHPTGGHKSQHRTTRLSDETAVADIETLLG